MGGNNQQPTTYNKKADFSILFCAGNGSRTHMTVRSGNFKSPAYTIPPSRQIRSQNSKNKVLCTRLPVGRQVSIWHGGEAVTLRSAKPSCAGSIPARASTLTRNNYAGIEGRKESFGEAFLRRGREHLGFLSPSIRGRRKDLVIRDRFPPVPQLR